MFNEKEDEIRLTRLDWVKLGFATFAFVALLINIGYFIGRATAPIVPQEISINDLDYQYRVGYITGACECLSRYDKKNFNKFNCGEEIKKNKPSAISSTESDNRVAKNE